MKGSKRAPDLPFVSLIICVLLSVAVGQAWLWKSERQIRDTWLDEERITLRRVLQNVRRSSFPETFFPMLLRRTISDLKAGRSTEDSFKRFQPWAGAKVEFLVFDFDGRRIDFPGFQTGRGAVSEKVLRTLREASPGSTAGIRKLSSSFIGMRTGLEKLAQSPHTMLAMGGSLQYSFAGWWPLTEKAKAGGNNNSNLVASGVAKSSKALSRFPAHVLILVRRNKIARYELLKEGLASVRRLLKGNAVLRLEARDSQWLAPTSSALKTGPQRIEERLPLDERLELRLSRKVESRGNTGFFLKAFETARHAVMWTGFLLIVLGFRQYRLLSAEQLSLGRMIRLGILGSVVPALILFLTWTIEFLHTSTITLSWQGHRFIENHLNQIDRESEGERRRLNIFLNQVSELLQGVPSSQAKSLVKAKLETCTQIESAYLIEPNGTVQAVLRQHPTSQDSQQKFALSVAVNLTAALQGREPKSISKESYDLTYLKGFTRHLLENLGRIDEMQGLGLRRSVFVSIVRDIEPLQSARFLVFMLNFDEDRRQYLQRSLAERNRGIWLGLAETGVSGPRRGYPDRLLNNTDLLSLCEETHRLKRPVDSRLVLHGRETFLTTAIPGQRLSGLILVGALPFKPIEQQIRVWLGTAIFVLVGVLIVAIGTALVLAVHLREGLGKISNGLEKLQDRSFHLPPAESDDQLARIYNGIVSAGRTLDELYSAVPVQKTLIFEGDVHKTGLSLSCRHIPGPFIGGDYMDVLELSQNRLMFCIGDSGGQSLAAALLTARVKMAVSLLSDDTDDPAMILQQLNELLLGLRFKRRHMSLLLGVISPDGKVVMANAGHCLPLANVSGNLNWIEERGLPLGSHLRTQVKCRSINLAPGEVLICFTNGWLKVFDPENRDLGFERLKESFKTSLHLDASSLSAFLSQQSLLLPNPDEPVEGRSLMIVRREITL